MKYLWLFLLAPVISVAQFQGPVPAISSGYGADGNHPVSHIDITNDHWDANHPISVFYPSDYTSAVPTIFYSHGYASTDTLYHIENIRHLVTRGYAVVFVPYKTVGVDIPERYNTLFDGFEKAAQLHPEFIDTSRVGFFGQSFGGGATPRLAYRAFTENNWGSNGKFIYCSAPWYSYELGSDNLPQYPVDCNMLTVLYDDDTTNDHRMGMDIFNHIAIPASHKDCLIVHSITVDGYDYVADHTLPAQYSDSGEFDALDSYVTFRLMDALADYSFTGNTTAQQMALGNGSTAQINMESLGNLTWTDAPSPTHLQSTYEFPCSADVNERGEFCQEILSVAQNQVEKILVYPNPASNVLSIQNLPQGNPEIRIVNNLGQVLKTERNATSIDVSDLKMGSYFLQINFDNQKTSVPFIKSSR
ncbi:T9SS type A sorting domain-containing protein [Flavobacterium silvaticum]|uniref:T9SS type A sorting domain-containing protein n=1 Tax=Flavobacterium silvaticum TaxID=1852020 RepID=A0A972FLN1_9FLAO|nr:T9SS type A sorting domain-containing protein [Flavobacterium silvaticum]NMH27505.1 T9SS type A sorting domain-containing protein [Flavobacterium silvaticum]